MGKAASRLGGFGCGCTILTKLHPQAIKNEGSAEKFCSFHLSAALELRDYSGSCWVKLSLYYADQIFEVIRDLKASKWNF